MPNDITNGRLPGESSVDYLKRTSKVSTGFRDNTKWRKDNRHWINISQEISLRVLSILRKNKLEKDTFLEKLSARGVDTTNIFNGKVNFTIASIGVMEEVLGEKIIFVPSGETCRFCDEKPVMFGEDICVNCQNEFKK